MSTDTRNAAGQACLADFVEQVSDDFQSTFSIVDSNTLANMMGLPGDFDVMKKIINRYIPGADVTFHKTNQLGVEEKYDIYLVRATLSEGPLATPIVSKSEMKRIATVSPGYAAEELDRLRKELSVRDEEMRPLTDRAISAEQNMVNMYDENKRLLEALVAARNYLSDCQVRIRAPEPYMVNEIERTLALKAKGHE